MIRSSGRNQNIIVFNKYVVNIESYGTHICCQQMLFRPTASLHPIPWLRTADGKYSRHNLLHSPVRQFLLPRPLRQ